MKSTYAIIGGGFFSMYLAEYFARRGQKVLLFEKENDFMQRASYGNQARVHHGYHYPRSVLTALRSRLLFPKFCQEFPGCIDDTFESYYLVGKVLGKVTANQFREFCRRIGAPCEPAPDRIRHMVNPRLVDAVFSTVECAFDAVKLKTIMRSRIQDAGVEFRLNTMVHSVASTRAGLEITVRPTGIDGATEKISASQVFNCTYSMTNFLLHNSEMELIPLKHEMTEMSLVEVSPLLKNKGMTVMCGPFFSVMPFPALGLHSFSHVRYTPHYEWHDEPGKMYINAHQHLAHIKRNTAWRMMQLDAQRYLPVLAECQYRDSIWEVKTVLPRSEVDDSRPILFKPDYGLKGFHCIMGGKIDNVYDAVEAIEKLGVVQ